MEQQRRIGFDYIGTAVVYFCHDGHGNFIMAERSGQARDEYGIWDVGGGAIEFEDTVEQTLHQEIKQEYGVDIISYEFLGYRDVHRTHNGQKTHWIALDFKVLVDPAGFKNGEPHKFKNVKWFTGNDIPKNIHSQLPTFLAKYKDQLF